jgi:hypothetical protein
MITRVPLAAVVTAALAAFGVAGCSDSPTATGALAQGRPSFATTAFVINAMRGTGGMGPGTPTFDGIERQWFDIDVGASGGMPYGRMEYIDSGFVKPEDGNHPHFVVGPQWPGTAILSFVPTSATCVAFEGVGYLRNTGELLGFRAEACDNGAPGAGLDTFGIEVPQRLLTHGGVYRAGPFFLVYGELTAAGMTTPSFGLP